MLTYIIRDIDNKPTAMKRPVRVMMISSDSAPADRLSAVFAIKGEVPILSSVEVKRNGERVFFGYIDEQYVQRVRSGALLGISARSLASVLLDNEARPQIYCCPSMPLLMKRHFEPLGFVSFKGTDKPFNGQLTVSKGMSEWSVLESFCRFLPGVKPKIDKYGRIDISGERNEELLFLSRDCIISGKHELKNSVLISEIRARTHISGGYDMPVRNGKAEKLGIKRKRYVDLADRIGNTVTDAKKMIENSCRAYERLTIECRGCFLCAPECGLKIEGDKRKYRVREMIYSFDSGGEKTKIEAEVIN